MFLNGPQRAALSDGVQQVISIDSNIVGTVLDVETYSGHAESKKFFRCEDAFRAV